MKRELTHGSLFSGVEGFGLGAGIKTEWSCEFEKYQTEVIKKNFGDVRPDYVIIENSPLLRKRGLEYVLHGLSEIGF